MAISRRGFLGSAAGLAATSLVGSAWGAGYPERPVRILVGFTPGTTTDILARLLADRLSARLGQPFIVENRPGAGSKIATEAVIQAAPDGHTLLLVVPANTINATLYDNLNYDFARDIAPVAAIIRTPFAMMINTSLPCKNVPEFIAYAKANPGGLNLASSGIGTGDHMAGELFKAMSAVPLQHLPYRGAPLAMTDLIGGQVHVLFSGLMTSVEHIRSGRVRALAVTTATRAESLPDVPAMAEFLPGYEASALFGLGAPRNTPVQVIELLNREINVALGDPAMKSRLADLSATPLNGSASEFGAMLVAETAKWRHVIRMAKIELPK